MRKALFLRIKPVQNSLSPHFTAATLSSTTLFPQLHGAFCDPLWGVNDQTLLKLTLTFGFSAFQYRIHPSIMGDSRHDGSTVALRRHSSRPPQTSTLTRSSHAMAIPLTRGHPGFASLRRQSFTPYNTPAGVSPRSPLDFLTQTPSLTARRSSLSSIYPINIQTPNSDSGNQIKLIDSFADQSNTGSSRVLGTLKHSHGRSNQYLRVNVKIGSSASSTASSTSDDSPGPSPLGKMDHLLPCPASPTMLPPADLLEMSPNVHPDVNVQRSIGAPFVNLNKSTVLNGPVSAISPLLSHHRRRIPRRGSNLAREMDLLDINDLRHAGNGYDAGASDDERDVRVPSPAPAHRPYGPLKLINQHSAHRSFLNPLSHTRNLGFQGHTLLARHSGTDVALLHSLLSQHSGSSASTTTPMSTTTATPAPPPTAAAPAKPRTEEEITARCKQLMNKHKVVLFMKGNPSGPKCGFSRQTVGLLREKGVEFAWFDILSDEEVRQGLKRVNDWPSELDLSL